jgi:uncharacterized protein with PhoU and TrkA domain
MGGPSGTSNVELISHRGQPLAMVIRRAFSPESTTFLTPDEFGLQVGYVVRSRGDEIPRHAHRKLTRQVDETFEVLVVQQGRCEVTLYDPDRNEAARRVLDEGDVIILTGGGHALHMLEDTVLLEVKQGPYVGPEEKEPF